MEGRNRYLARYAYPDQGIFPESRGKVENFIVIPVLDEPKLDQCLDSLRKCDKAEGLCELILVFNHSESADASTKERNLANYKETKRQLDEHPIVGIETVVLLASDLPEKKAGVGLARKIGLDLAIRRAKGEAILTCLDADCLVDKTYLCAIERYFNKYSESVAASIYFEHPLVGELQDHLYEGIARYELFLRYFIQAQRYAGFPYAFHTVGSAMAVRASAYVQQGGMNTRKAGEDFYFLHRFIPHGGFGEINNTRVIPSPRTSDRVPFGTGRAMSQWLKNGLTNSYSIDTFDELRQLFGSVTVLYKGENLELADSLVNFLEEQQFEESLEVIRSKSASFSVFHRHFFQWFNAFRVMKFANFRRSQVPDSSDLVGNAIALLQKHNVSNLDLTVTQLLSVYRDWDKSGKISA